MNKEIHKSINGNRTEAAVVVGVDGSPGAKAALRWALEEARLRKAPLRAVHAWAYGYIGGSVESHPYWAGSLGAYTSLGIDIGELHRGAEDLLERALADVAVDAEGVEIECQVVQGFAAKVLVAAVSKDDLLVVGSRGHGGFAGLLLGSVSQQCVHHAPCPVVVVHVPKSTAAADEQALSDQEKNPAPARA
jgi:nucleotide-binding universal stress UspA family protein